jgi:hypothetical protein
VRDIAWLAEHIVMSDIPDDFWNDASSSTAPLLQKRLNSREEAPFFAPDKVGDVVARTFDEADQCAVRWQRALWATAGLAALVTGIVGAFLPLLPSRAAALVGTPV